MQVRQCYSLRFPLLLDIIPSAALQFVNGFMILWVCYVHCHVCTDWLAGGPALNHVHNSVLLLQHARCEALDQSA